MNKVYDIPRPEIAERFGKLISYRGIKTVFRKELYIESLALYAKHSMDIQDIFLAVFAGDRDCAIITFDADFKKMRCRHGEPG